MCLASCRSFLFAIFLFIFGLICLFGAKQEYLATQTFVQNECTVKNIDVKENSREKSWLRPTKIIYQQIWHVKLKNGNIKEEINIIDSKRWRMDNDDNNYEKIRTKNEYQIDRTYLCYHSPTDPINTTRWNQPSLILVIFLMIFGVGSLIISLYFCFVLTQTFHFYQIRCEGCIPHIQKYTRSHTTAPITIDTEETVVPINVTT